jgi:hypothetical protein
MTVAVMVTIRQSSGADDTPEQEHRESKNCVPESHVFVLQPKR